MAATPTARWNLPAQEESVLSMMLETIPVASPLSELYTVPAIDVWGSALHAPVVAGRQVLNDGDSPSRHE